MEARLAQTSGTALEARTQLDREGLVPEVSSKIPVANGREGAEVSEWAQEIWTFAICPAIICPCLLRVIRQLGSWL